LAYFSGCKDTKKKLNEIFFRVFVIFWHEKTLLLCKDFRIKIVCMKKILFVCLVGVALMMGACGEKESSDNGGATTATHDIVYYVDGENQQSTGLSDSQWDILLEG
jgi:hypothetical protein